MIYRNLFEQTGDRRIRAGIIGIGTYGISLIAQAQSRLRILRMKQDKTFEEKATLK